MTTPLGVKNWLTSGRRGNGEIFAVIAALFVLVVAAAVFITLGQYSPFGALTNIGYLFIAVIVIIVVLIVILLLR